MGFNSHLKKSVWSTRLDPSVNLNNGAYLKIIRWTMIIRCTMYTNSMSNSTNENTFMCQVQPVLGMEYSSFTIHRE